MTMMSKRVNVTVPMKQRSVVNEGDKTRLYSVIKKAARGETITFSVIGGSITNGCHAETRRESYAELTAGWWKDRFPWVPVNYINAGIGATDSYIGVHRAEADLLVHRPDVVIAEFSVNDMDEKINSDSYRSLINRILCSESYPAVILLFTVKEDGTNFQKLHSETGFAYNLPMISYADAVIPEIQTGNFTWKDISPDDIHPSSEGHRIIAELINDYMDKVYSEAFSADIKKKQYKSEQLKYSSARILSSRITEPDFCTGFEKSSVSSQFPDNWTTTVPGIIEHSVNASNIGIMYMRTVSEKGGMYSVFIDGKHAADLDADFSGGWGDYTAYTEVYSSDRPSEHHIRIVKHAESESDLFTVVGLCIS